MLITALSLYPLLHHELGALNLLRERTVTHADKAEKISVLELSLVHFRHHSPTPARSYALTIRWLPPSLLTGDLWDTKTFRTNSTFETLIILLGCFPLDKEPSRSMSHSSSIIRSLTDFLHVTYVNSIN